MRHRAFCAAPRKRRCIDLLVVVKPMPTETAVKEAAPVNGTNADKPLTTPVAEKLGQLNEAKLQALLRSSMLDEPAQDAVTPASAPVAEEKPTESTSEEVPANADATKDNPDLSQEPTEQDSSTEEATTTEDSQPEVEEATEDGSPKGVQKRIDKLTALRREAEAKAKQLEEQVADLQNKLQAKPAVDDAPVRPTPDNPYLHLQTQAEVDAAISEARKVRRWCEMHPDGTVVRDANGKETDYSAEDIRAIRLNATDALEEHLPRQLQYVQTRSQVDPLAEQEYRWWKDRTSKEYAVAQNMLKVFPELRKFPDYKMVVGDYIRGAAERESKYAQQKAAATAKPVVKKAPAQPTRPTATPPSVTSKERIAQEAQGRFRKAPTTDALKDVLLNGFLE